MKMTPAQLILGSILVAWASIFILVLLPAATMNYEPSDNWLPWPEAVKEGNDLYVKNGCSYCHSRFIRVNDWGVGAERIAEPGDYNDQLPSIFGTERTGPDLSQEGGEHPSDWQLAHFINPRNTSPLSLMPSWEFLGRSKIEKLIKFVQAQGGKMARVRVNRQAHWKTLAVEAKSRGSNYNIKWLHSMVPEPWLAMPNPYPASDAALARGKTIYQHNCIGCHGPIGDGQGKATLYLNPKPLNFTELRRHLVEGKYIGGIFYYQIMNGITGTAMPYFKDALESEKIWDVSNYVAVNFVGYSDADIAPEGIDASYEEEYVNPYEAPKVKKQIGGEEE